MNACQDKMYLIFHFYNVPQFLLSFRIRKFAGKRKTTVSSCNSIGQCDKLLLKQSCQNTCIHMFSLCDIRSALWLGYLVWSMFEEKKKTKKNGRQCTTNRTVFRLTNVCCLNTTLTEWRRVWAAATAISEFITSFWSVFIRNWCDFMKNVKPSNNFQ